MIKTFREHTKAANLSSLISVFSSCIIYTLFCRNTKISRNSSDRFLWIFAQQKTSTQSIRSVNHFQRKGRLGLKFDLELKLLWRHCKVIFISIASKVKLYYSLRSRRLEVVGERESRRERGRHARTSPLACLLLARPFFLVPTNSKRLLRRLIISKFNLCDLKYMCCNGFTIKINLFQYKRFKDWRCTDKTTGSSHFKWTISYYARILWCPVSLSRWNVLYFEKPVGRAKIKTSIH